MFWIALFNFLFLSGFCFSKKFDYEGRNGPSHWGEKFKMCIGKHQSPINIEEHNVKNVRLMSLKLDGINSPLSSIVTNNGHTVLLKSQKSKKITLSGGPLRDIYVFEQLHFHWGKNDHRGSEHLINNHSFSMEIHAVFYKKNYKSIDKALKHDDGLTVLAYFYEVNCHQNAALKLIVTALPDVQEAGKEITLRRSLLLEKLLMPDIATMQDYFIYNGSLTTPPCLEIVTWIVFKDHQYLSHKQLAAFRNVENQKGKKLTHNFRPPESLQDRVVFQNIPKKRSIHHDDCLFERYYR